MRYHPTSWATLVWAQPSTACDRYCLHAGLGLRMPVTFLVMTGSKFTFLEKLFFAIAWSPKVGIQFVTL